MSNGGLFNSLEDALGIDTTAGNTQLQEALQAIQGIKAPTQQQLTLPDLQKYIDAGILTQDDAQALLANPDAYKNSIAQTQDNTGKSAQGSALQQMLDLYQNGGSNAINEANLVNNLNHVKQEMNAQNQGVAEQARERGVSGSGLEFISQLLNNQGASQTANTNAVNSAASNAQLALQALSGAGSLGGTMQGQSNQMSQAQAQAAQQVAEYNSQLGSQFNLANMQAQNLAKQYNTQTAQNIANQNTGLSNYQTQYNAQIPQTLYQDQLGKAQDLAGVYGNQANLAEQQAAQNNAFIGNTIGAAATMGGSYLAGNALGNALAAGKNTGGVTTGSNSAPQFYTTAGGVNDYNANLQPMSGPKLPSNQFTLNNGYADGGMVEPCYFKGGNVAHDHAICMKYGGRVPGQAAVAGNSIKNDTVPAVLSPKEIVLPRSVTMAPNAPAKAAKFVQKVKNPAPAKGSFADVLKALEGHGVSLHLKPTTVGEI